MSHHRGVWIHHDRQAVDGDTLLACRIARTGRPPSLRSTTGNIDHTPQPAIRIFVEQRQCEINRAGNRSAGALANRRSHDPGGQLHLQMLYVHDFLFLLRGIRCDLVHICEKPPAPA